jgi:hypothetical protein
MNECKEMNIPNFSNDYLAQNNIHMSYISICLLLALPRLHNSIYMSNNKYFSILVVEIGHEYTHTYIFRCAQKKCIWASHSKEYHNHTNLFSQLENKTKLQLANVVLENTHTQRFSHA